MGDHGGQFFEIYKEESLTEISPFLEKNAINKKDYLLDMYNIFIAIKWPKDIKKETATINFAPELFKLILEKIIPNTKIPEPSHLFFNFEGVPIKDLFWEDI